MNPTSQHIDPRRQTTANKQTIKVGGGSQPPRPNVVWRRSNVCFQECFVTQNSPVGGTNRETAEARKTLWPSSAAAQHWIVELYSSKPAWIFELNSNHDACSLELLRFEIR
mmetsp:Transcript_14287/g.39707  ORF Transcript_14287/g.39707 Transcript_14287/m.39707 type:complete len:111 (-) Transcript_14287:956-1288(-)